MEAKLIVVGGKASKKAIGLKLPTVIGRSRDAGLTVVHPMISRRHCEIFDEEGLLNIRDLGSLNGTIVDGSRVSLAAIRPNDEFTIGPLTFRAEYRYDGPIDETPRFSPLPAQGESADDPMPSTADFETPAAEDAVDVDELDADEEQAEPEPSPPPLLQEKPPATKPAAPKKRDPRSSDEKSSEAAKPDAAKPDASAAESDADEPDDDLDAFLQGLQED